MSSTTTAKDGKSELNGVVKVQKSKLKKDADNAEGASKRKSKKNGVTAAEEANDAGTGDARVKKRKLRTSSTESKVKKVKVELAQGGAIAEAPAEDVLVEALDANSVKNFGLDKGIEQLLADKGITSLFDIQAACIPHTIDGKDVVGRARTGCGKTYAFVLPIVEMLMREKVKPVAGGPNVICLLPTRELAQQVHRDFEHVGQAGSLRTLCVYGGSAYGPQEAALRRGVHVVVGTPGRVKDHIERGTMKMQKLRFRILDECDEMLNMGFADDVEAILGAAKESAGVQTLLFSATMPPWVRDLQRKYLSDNVEFIDLVGHDKMKASRSVDHKVLYCHWSQRASIVQDLVKCYGFSGRTIVFSETKNDCNELSAQLSETIGARALHGDIPQGQREVTLKGFRDGRFSVLVATDVAARGLDISGVDLVLQMDPPKDFETYIHRSGRTGRAGGRGVCITMCSRNKEDRVPWIERKAGFQFERIGPPQPREMALVAAQRAVETIADVQENVVPWFIDAARQLLDASESAEVALAKALAKITGHTDLKRRSLLTAHEGYTTFLFAADWTIERPGYVFGFLRRRVREELVDQVKGMRLTKDQKGAVFDVPVDVVDDFVASCAVDTNKRHASSDQVPPRVGIAEELPELKPRDDEGQEGNTSWGGGWGRGRGGGGARGSPSGRGARGGRGSRGGRGFGRGSRGGSFR